MNKRNSIFLVTTPLQYFNASNIEDDNYRICLIVNWFQNAINLHEKIEKQSSLWNEVHSFENIFNAFIWLVKNSNNTANLYIDSDYGFRKYHYLRQLKSLNIYVYEEGIGTYRRNIRNNKVPNKFVSLFYKCLGHREYLGGAKYTRGIYVYDMERYLNSGIDNKKEIKRFKETFIDHLDAFEDKNLFLDEKNNHVLELIIDRKVILYLTSWQYNSKVEKILIQYNDYIKILKPHPHSKLDLNAIKCHYNYIIDGGGMVEFFISEAIKVTEELIVIHENSSAMVYFKAQGKTKSIII